MIMNYIIAFPPNTKNAFATKSGKLLVVFCPHCGGSHFHQLVDVYKTYVEAGCKKGFYVIKLEKQENEP